MGEVANCEPIGDLTSEEWAAAVISDSGPS
jgi:hypothetical protein